MEEEYLNFSPLSLEIDFDDDDGINFNNLFQMKIFWSLLSYFNTKPQWDLDASCKMGVSN